MNHPYPPQVQLKESLKKAIDQNLFAYERKLSEWMSIMLADYNDQMPMDTLFSALVVKHNSLNAKALEWLTLRLQGDFQANPLRKGQVLASIGDLHSNKNELRKLLKSEGIGYSAKINNQVTHILIGHRLSEDALETLLASQQQFVLMTEAMLLEFKKECSDTFLLGETASETQIAQVSELLLHPDEANVELAFSLLKSGGVPKELITELFIVYRFSDNATLSGKAQKMLKLHGSVALQELMPKLKRNWWSVQYEDWLAKTELKAWKIFQYAYLSQPTNFNLLKKAMDTTPADEITTFLCTAMEKWQVSAHPESLYIPAEFDFETYFDIVYHQSNLKTFYIDARPHQRLKALPIGISRLIHLEKLIIETALSEFPKELQQLPSLKSLKLNVLSIRSLKGAFDSGFQNLDTLIMRQLRLTELPFGIGNLSKLKFIDLQGGDLRSLPPDFRSLTNLEELILTNNKFNTIPDVLFLMPQLKKLHLSGYWSEKEIRNLAALREALPNTVVLF